MFACAMEHRLLAHEVGHSFGLRPIFDGVTISCESGQIWGVLGPNGVGKSTLLKILGGLLEPTRGRVRYVHAERSVTGPAISSWVGLVAPYANLYEEFSAFENLYWVLALRGVRPCREQLEAALRRVELPAARWHEPLRFFSSGMKQRARLAAALVAEPWVLLLDEPTTNLDASGVRKVRALMEEEALRGRIVILATNTAEEASWCTHRLDLQAYRTRLHSKR
ncbi:MAG: ABC transporter ATP-binding protein [Bacteroidota bacterium]|nr:ABC transporter ATP-binding protein [Rhodothermia bacterium]MDW8285176.1 ABC transporter ATP-binding protein [Bacteroidota bacterium]